MATSKSMSRSGTNFGSKSGFTAFNNLACHRRCYKKSCKGLTTYEEELVFYPISVDRVDCTVCGSSDNGSKNSSESRHIKVANKPVTRTLRSSRKYESYHYIQEDDDEDNKKGPIKYKSSYKKKLDLVLEDFEPNGSYYYVYLLLDSRKVLQATDNTKAFADAIIYASKGKNIQAMRHIKQAKKALWEDGKIGNKKMINKIHDIWKGGSSVQVLKVAENISREEALTQEAFLRDTIGNKRLNSANKKKEYYGIASTFEEKREIGFALLEEGRKMLAKKGAKRFFSD